MIDIKRDKIDYEGKFVKVVTRDGWYEFIHNAKSNSEGVCVLVHDYTDSSNPKILGRFERTICHEKGYSSPKVPDLNLTSITGSCDKKGKTPEEIAIMELEEEAGIIAKAFELRYHGVCYPSKISDTLIHLYSFDGSKSDLGEVKGDGTRGEEDAYVEWMSFNDFFKNTNCPMSGLIFSRLVRFES